MLIFWVLGVIGIVILLLALTLGEVIDGFLGLDGVDMLDSDIFSTAGIAGLLGGFGFTAAIVSSLTEHTVAAIVVGLVVGVGLAWAAGRLTRALRSQSSEVRHSTASLVGAEGTVITEIPADGYGQVRLSADGHRPVLNARSVIQLPPGTRVRVVGVLSPTAVEVREAQASEDIQDSRIWPEQG